MSSETDRVIELPILFQNIDTELTFNLEDSVGEGTNNYLQLRNIPKINGKYVTGEHDAEYYGLLSGNSNYVNSAAMSMLLNTLLNRRAISYADYTSIRNAM